MASFWNRSTKVRVEISQRVLRVAAFSSGLFAVFSAYTEFRSPLTRGEGGWLPSVLIGVLGPGVACVGFAFAFAMFGERLQRTSARAGWLVCVALSTGLVVPAIAWSLTARALGDVGGFHGVLGVLAFGSIALFTTLGLCFGFARGWQAMGSSWSIAGRIVRLAGGWVALVIAMLVVFSPGGTAKRRLKGLRAGIDARQRVVVLDQVRELESLKPWASLAPLRAWYLEDSDPERRALISLAYLELVGVDIESRIDSRVASD